jgi:hypothetical protein
MAIVFGMVNNRDYLKKDGEVNTFKAKGIFLRCRKEVYLEKYS